MLIKQRFVFDKVFAEAVQKNNFNHWWECTESLKYDIPFEITFRK